jgi:hypothetical protein
MVRRSSPQASIHVSTKVFTTQAGRTHSCLKPPQPSALGTQIHTIPGTPDFTRFVAHFSRRWERPLVQM